MRFSNILLYNKKRLINFLLSRFKNKLIILRTLLKLIRTNFLSSSSNDKYNIIILFSDIFPFNRAVFNFCVCLNYIARIFDLLIKKEQYNRPILTGYKVIDSMLRISHPILENPIFNELSDKERNRLKIYCEYLFKENVSIYFLYNWVTYRILFNNYVNGLEEEDVVRLRRKKLSNFIFKTKDVFTLVEYQISVNFSTLEQKINEKVEAELEETMAWEKIWAEAEEKEKTKAKVEAEEESDFMSAGINPMVSDILSAILSANPPLPDRDIDEYVQFLYVAYLEFRFDKFVRKFKYKGNYF
jgi:hypothetical protein